MKIGIIGGGVMGEILADSLIKKEVFAKEDIEIYDIHERKLFELKEKYGIIPSSSIGSILKKADLIILSVKPQNINDVIIKMKGKLSSNQLIISIIAGVTLRFLKEGLKHQRVIRSMPNIASKISEGMTVWIAGSKADEYDKMLAKMIFQSFGREVEVEFEDLVDSATAISGSGPAYIFYIAETLMEAALELRYDKEDALKLVMQTFKGSMNLWAETNEEPETLRHKVTSAKGTTEAAINCFNNGNLKEKFISGVKAAYDRSKELGKA
ncbi:MAG: pyrroline-5-carboxylate reductase [Pseudomonadota bacterium]